MTNKILLSFVITCFLSANIFAQHDVLISCEKNNTGDTIWVTAKGAASQKPGTLLLTALHVKSGSVDSIFLPLVDTVSLFALVVPQNYREGKLRLTGFYYPKIFEVSGMVLNKINDEKIRVLLITNNKRIYNKELKLSDDKQFQLPGLIFENKGSLIFNYSITNKKERPNIIIKQTPSSENFKEVIFSQEILLTEERYVDTVQSTVPNKHLSGKDKNDKSITMKEVVVNGKTKTKAEKFNEEYSTALFNDPGEKVVDCLDNKDILSYPDCLSFLRSRIAGLITSFNRFGESSLTWRGKDVQAFYIDEISVDLEQILNLPVSDIAIIKAYPPPFFGAMDGSGDGGAIAVYTRQDEYRRENSTNNKWLFSIKGYSPAIHVLFEK